MQSISRRNSFQPKATLATAAVAAFAVVVGACGDAPSELDTASAITHEATGDNPWQLAVSSVWGGEELNVVWTIPVNTPALDDRPYKLCWKESPSGEPCGGSGHHIEVTPYSSGAISVNAPIGHGWSAARYDKPTGKVYVTIGRTTCGGKTYKVKVKGVDDLTQSTVNVTTAPCATPPNVLGSPVVCPGATSTYSLSLAAGTYNWAVSGGLEKAPGESGTNPTVTVRANGLAPVGTITLTTDRYPVITRQIATAKPSQPSGGGFVLALDDGVHCFNKAFVQPVSGATSYVWTAPVNQETTGTQTNGNLLPNRQYSISVSAKNACGVSTPFTYTGMTWGCTGQ